MDRFLHVDTGSGGPSLTDGTASIYVASVRARELEPDLPVRTSSDGSLASSRLQIDDVVDLSTRLAAAGSSTDVAANTTKLQNVTATSGVTTITGSLTVGGNLVASSTDVAANTTKLQNVTATSGVTTITGSLTVGGNSVLTAAGGSTLTSTLSTTQSSFSDANLVTKSYVDSHEGHAADFHRNAVKTYTGSLLTPGTSIVAESVRGIRFTLTTAIEVTRILYDMNMWLSNESERSVRIYPDGNDNPVLDVYLNKTLNDGTHYYKPISDCLLTAGTWVIAFYVSEAYGEPVKDPDDTAWDYPLTSVSVRTSTPAGSSEVAERPTNTLTSPYYVGNFQYVVASESAKTLRSLDVTHDTTLSTSESIQRYVNDHMKGAALLGYQSTAPTLFDQAVFTQFSGLACGTSGLNADGGAYYPNVPNGSGSGTSFQSEVDYSMSYTTAVDHQFVALSWGGNPEGTVSSNVHKVYVNYVSSASGNIQINFFHGQAQQYTTTQNVTVGYAGTARVQYEVDPQDSTKRILRVFLGQSPTTLAKIVEFPHAALSIDSTGAGVEGGSSGSATNANTATFSRIEIGPLQTAASLSVKDGGIAMAGRVTHSGELNVAGRFSTAHSSTVHGDDPHTLHGRRLQATDRITVDSNAAMDHASLEANAHNLSDASLKLSCERTNPSYSILKHEASSGNTTLAVREGTSAEKTSLSINRATGDVTFAQSVSAASATVGGNAVLTTQSSEFLTLQSNVTTAQDTATEAGTAATAAQTTADAALPLTGGTISGHITGTTCEFHGATTTQGNKFGSATFGDTWLPYHTGDNYLSAANHYFRNASNTTVAHLDSSGSLSLNGDLTVSSASPTLALVDTDQNSDFRIFLESGHLRIQDTTNGNRDFLVANSSGDCNVGVSGQTTAVMGKLDVNGDAQVRRVFCRDTTNNKIEFIAGATVGGAHSNPIRLFDNSSGSVRIGGGTATVQVNNFDVQGSLTMSNANKLSTKLEVYSASVIKTVGISITPTGNWQDLFTSSYPSLTIPSAQVGDIVEVRGTLAEDHASNGYGNMSSVFQYVVREGSSSGTDIHTGSVSIVAGGDNNIENSMGHYYMRTAVQTAGDIFVGLRYKAANTQARTIVACAQGSTSSLFVRLRRPVTVALAS